MTLMFKKTIVLTCVLSLFAFLGCEDKKSNDNKAQEKSTPSVKTANVTILSHKCDPMELTVESGKTKFIINNKSDKPVEWEILKGIRIIDERENIIPGFKRELTAFLDPGVYEMTCGLLSNPKGKLIVKLAKGASEFRKPTSVEFAGALGEYKVYTIIETSDLLSEAKKLQSAILEGNLKDAKSAYVSALTHYDKIESFLKQFSSIDQLISASSSLYEKGEKDENFKGFHRIEIGLFKNNSTENLDKFAEELVTNISNLPAEVKKTQTSDSQLLKYSTSLVALAQDTKLKGIQNPYAKNDISSLQANIDGSYRIFKLIKSMLDLANPNFAKTIEKDYVEALKITDKYKDGVGYKTYENLSKTDKQDMEKLLGNLQTNLEKLPDELGIN